MQSQKTQPAARRGGNGRGQSGAFWICNKGSCRQWTFCDKLQCHDCGGEAPKWVKALQSEGNAPAGRGASPSAGGTLGAWQVAQSKSQRRKARKAAAVAAKAGAPSDSGVGEDEEGMAEAAESEVERSSASSAVRTCYVKWSDVQLETTLAALRALDPKPASVEAEISALEGEVAKRQKPVDVPVPLHTLERKAQDKCRKLRVRAETAEAQLQAATKAREKAVSAEREKEKELAEAKAELMVADQALAKCKLQVTAISHPETVVNSVAKADLEQPEVKQVVGLFQQLLSVAGELAEQRTQFLAGHGLQAMPDLSAADPADAVRVSDLRETERQLGAFGTTVVDMFRKAQSRQAVALAELVGQQSTRAKTAGSSPAGAAAAAAGATPAASTQSAPTPTGASTPTSATSAAGADPAAAGGAGAGGAGMDTTSG